jgi:diacylglycerol kinase (ATP)
VKPETWLESLNCAVEGVLHAVQSQRHVRWHLLAALTALALAPLLSLSPAEFALLALAAGGVLISELLNTALEAVVDLASPGFQPLARTAKDVAAGAVLVAAFVAAAVWWVVLWPRVSLGAAAALDAVDRSEPVVIASILLCVLVLVIFGKTLVGRGRPLHGGFPSGHAAVAFSLATLLALRTRDPTVTALSALMALMVSHSRLLLRVHSRAEVIAGGSLGATVTALLYWLFT